MLFQPSEITPDVLNGTGCIDAAAPFTLSWRLGGTSPLAAWKADIYENLTPVWSSGKITLQTPVYPLDPTGSPRRFSVEINTNDSRGIEKYHKKYNPPRITGRGGTPQGWVGHSDLPAEESQKNSPALINGHEYRLLITQWDSSNVQTTQTTPSVFLCRSAPVLALSVPSTLSSRSCVITASYSQTENDPIASMLWTARVDGEDIIDPIEITGAAEPSLTLSGLLPGTTVTVSLSVKTEAGASAEARASFPVSYPLSPERGAVLARSRDGLGCILVSWTRYAGAASYSVLRRRGESGSLEAVADCPATVGSLRDYAVLAGETYTYYVFPSGPSAFLALPVVSDPVRADLTAFRLIEIEETGSGVFTPVKVHLFTCSDGEPVPGGVSNNNIPSLRPGLSQYPVRLPSPSNYASGILSSYLGDVREELQHLASGEKPDNPYNNSALPTIVGRLQPVVNGMPVACQSRRVTEPQREGTPQGWVGPRNFPAGAIQNLSSPLILLTPSGGRYLVSTSGPIITKTNYKSPRMPVSVSIHWVETGPAPTAVTALISSGFLPVDGIIFSSFSLNPATGILTETTELSPRSAETSTLLSLSPEGFLLASQPTSTDPAILSLSANFNLLVITEDGSR